MHTDNTNSANSTTKYVPTFQKLGTCFDGNSHQSIFSIVGDSYLIDITMLHMDASSSLISIPQLHSLLFNISN